MCEITAFLPWPIWAIVFSNPESETFCKTLLNCLKQESVYFVICPKQGPEMEDVILNRAGILGLFCPKQDQGFRPSAAPYTRTWVKCSPPYPEGGNWKQQGC